MSKGSSLGGGRLTLLLEAKGLGIAGRFIAKGMRFASGKELSVFRIDLVIVRKMSKTCCFYIL